MDNSNKAVEYYINSPNSSIRKVSKMFNIDRRRLSKLLKTKNIEIVNHKSRKYYCNFNYFDTIDSEEKAYWLGFILADGCIDKQNKFEISLKEDDKYILEAFNKCLESTYPILESKSSGGFGIPESIFSVLIIQNEYFVASLKEYGIIHNKSLYATFNYNNKIPAKYMNAYLRGIFDGDGWFVDSRHTKGKSKEIGFCGTEDVCLGIQKVLKDTFGMNYRVTQDKSIYRIRICSTANILKLYNFMYKDATYFLKRKYDKLKLFADSNETIK